MGTNYYWHSRPTRIISRVDRPRSTEIHVGRSGWIFRGWEEGDQPDETSPFTIDAPIRTRREWASFFIRHAGGFIVDSYGKGTLLTPYAWVMGIRPPTAKDVESPGSRHGRPCQWRDPEGFRFVGEPFS
jgi:hypothetical protein